MSLTNSPFFMASTSTGFYDFPIEQSLRFNDNDSAYLSRTPATAGNRKTWTWSCWVKRGNLNANVVGNIPTLFAAQDTSAGLYNFIAILNNVGNDVIYAQLCSTPSNAAYVLETSQVFRDIAGWYHIVWSVDTTQATASDRAKLYVNGERVTSFGTETYPPQNTDTDINYTVEHNIGKFPDYTRYYDGYMAEVNFIDGQALDPTSFGETKSGIWIPKDTAGLTFGTNGFRLQFGDTTEASGFNTVTWTGNNTNGGNAVGGVGFSPDMVWAKSRSDAYSPLIYDSIRGTGATAELKTDGTEAEGGSSSSERGYLNSFDADGFSSVVGSNGDNLYFNQSGRNYVAWCWDAGSGSPASNTDGSITSTVKANTDYGFSIATFTGTGANATVGHGLTSAPELVILKNRSIVSSWLVRSSELAANQTLLLENTTTPIGTDYWQNTQPDSSVITVSSNSEANGSGNNLVAYCFAEKTGYSKFGSYSGTGAVGNSITTGFKPAFIMIKRTDAAFGWYMYDTTRQVQNPMGSQTDPLLANSSNAEGGPDPSWYIDVTDTGFTINNTSLFDNASGGTYIYMAFADTRNAAFWKDTSGQGNDWQPNNLVFSDVVPDGTNSFATMNILDDNYASPKFSYSEGNLKYTYGYTGVGFDRVFGSIAISPNDTNKYYFEFTGNVTNEQMQWGVVSTDSLAYSVADRDNGLSATANASQLRWASYLSAPYLYRVDSSTTDQGALLTTSNGNAANGAIYSLVYDADAGKFYAWFNGVEFTGQNYAAGTSLWATMDTSKTYMVMMYQGDGGASTKSGNMTANFGQDSSFAGAKARQGNTDANGLGDFYYPVPDGALALCTANLPSGAINTLNDETPEDYFNTVLYSGNSTNNTPITVGFQPSMTWIKTRNVVRDHRLMDAVRGATAGIYPNLTNAEGGSPLISFDTDGFTLNNTDNYNNSGETYASWNWKAGGTGVSNTDGSITSTVSVGATSQQNWFSIVKYTGTGANATVGHGLDGTVPEMIIAKRRNTTGSWGVYHSGMTSATYQMWLNLTNGETSRPAQWNSTAPTSSVFSIGTDTDVNASGSDYIAYCFANAEGLCKVGSYVGNGSTDGTFVYTGFRPAWILIKNASASTDWILQDNRRLGYNVDNNDLIPNQSYAEATDDRLDQLSNGFKLRSTFGTSNTSGQTYIYLAIAEQPFAFANAR